MPDPVTIGAIASGVQIGSGLISNLLSGRDRRKQEEANRRRSAYSNMIRSLGVAHQPYFEDYKPGGATRLFGGISQAAGLVSSAVGAHQVFTQGAQKIAEAATRKAATAGTAKGLELITQAQTRLKGEPFVPWAKQIQNITRPQDMKDEDFSVYRAAIKSSIDTQLKDRRVIEASQARDRRTGQADLLRLQQTFRSQQEQTRQFDITSKASRDRQAAIQAGLDKAASDEQQQIKSFSMQLIKNPHRGAEIMENIPSNLMGGVFADLTVQGKDVMSLVQHTMSEQDGSDFQALLRWKYTYDDYKSEVTKLFKDDQLGIVQFGKDNNWTFDNLAKQLPGSPYTGQFNSLQQKREALIIAFHQANVPGIMTNEDYNRESLMVPDVTSIFMEGEMGKFQATDVFQKASEDAFFAELKARNVHTDFAYGILNPEATQALPLGETPQGETPVSRANRLFTTQQQEIPIPDAYTAQPTEVDSSAFSPAQVSRKSSLMPPIQQQEMPPIESQGPYQPLGLPMGEVPAPQQIEVPTREVTPPTQTFEAPFERLSSVSPEHLIEGLGQRSPSVLAGAEIVDEGAKAAQARELFPLIPEGSLEVDNLSDFDNRIALAKALQLMGFEERRINEMQLDDIAEAFQTKQARDLKMQGLIAGNPFVNPSATYSTQASQWLQEKSDFTGAKSAGRPYGSAIGRSLGYAR